MRPDVMTQSYKEKPSYRFPSKLDMLAQFGLDPEVEEDALPSFTYRFGTRDAIETVITFSGVIGFVDVSMYSSGYEVLAISTNDVAEMRICEERGACWLQVTYETTRALPDLFIHIEPRLSCRWG